LDFVCLFYVSHLPKPRFAEKSRLFQFLAVLGGGTGKTGKTRSCFTTFQFFTPHPNIGKGGKTGKTGKTGKAGKTMDIYNHPPRQNG
jgi:hypothetical protein